MDIVELRDLIQDERGNYYVAVRRSGNELTLVNAFVETSFRERLAFDEEFKARYREYENQFIGKIPMDDLRHQYVDSMNPEVPGALYRLDEVMREYPVTFIDTIEFFRHPGGR